MPGASKEFYVLVYATPSVAAAGLNTLLVTATSVGDATKVDAVKAVTTLVGNYQPDMLIKGSGTASYTGGGISNADGTGQTISKTAALGQQAAYYFSVRNAGNAVDAFKITGLGSDGGWVVSYFERYTNVNITSKVTGGGWTTAALMPGASKEFYVLVYGYAPVSTGSIDTLLITGTSVADGTKRDVAQAATTRQ